MTLRTLINGGRTAFGTRWSRRRGRVSALLILGMLGLTACAGGSAESATQPASTSTVVATSEKPKPPRIPENFSWSGRYVVPDLGIEVPFTWRGNDGDFQMVAGGKGHPIHFTNLIADGELYTLTYKWPDIPRKPCSHVGAFTLRELNAGFAKASYAGRETLHGEETREVHHFRSVGVVDLPPGLVAGTEEAPQLRLPIMSGDIYVDIEDPTKIWQLLHFGVQNLYDPNLDEWIIIDEIDDQPGRVEKPKECTAS